MKQTQVPRFISWLDRWSLRVGLGVFALLIVANLIVNESKVWLPFAVMSIIMGVFCFYAPRVLVRLVKSTSSPSYRRTKFMLLSWLVPAGLFLLALAPGLALSPRSGVVNALAVLMPAALGASVAGLWLQASSVAAGKAPLGELPANPGLEPTATTPPRLNPHRYADSEAAYTVSKLSSDHDVAWPGGPARK